MNPYIFIIASIIIVIIIILAYHSTDYKGYETYPQDSQERYNIHKMRMVKDVQKKQLKNRCVPSEILYDNSYVKNKGFINETMYKPDADTSQLKFENKLIENNIPVNDDRCILSTDLPLGNIHTSYLINKNSSKLSL
jgi:hypothetical protein